ncbi:Trm112 family protein [Fodinibius sp. Rm-B-1B1-1]|uniref:Trm112 family protein n=1 Tax=Fodinibius alkaliphilus TaxID=3140241 RepID=UPI00315B32D3
MTKELLEKLCCPIDKHDLDANIINEREDGEILEGLLSCPECNRYFPVIYGIPILIPDEYRDESMEKPLLKKWGYELAEGEDSALPLLAESER